MFSLFESPKAFDAQGNKVGSGVGPTALDFGDAQNSGTQESTGLNIAAFQQQMTMVAMSQQLHQQQMQQNAFFQAMATRAALQQNVPIVTTQAPMTSVSDPSILFQFPASPSGSTFIDPSVVFAGPASTNLMVDPSIVQMGPSTMSSATPKDPSILIQGAVVNQGQSVVVDPSIVMQGLPLVGGTTNLSNQMYAGTNGFTQGSPSIDPSILSMGPVQTNNMDTMSSSSTGSKSKASMKSSAVEIVDPTSGKQVDLGAVTKDRQRISSPIEIIDPKSNQVVQMQPRMKSKSPPKRESLQIIDPQTGEEVVLGKREPKQRRALEIVDPSSGEAIVPGKLDDGASKVSKGLAIVDPTSGEELVITNGEGRSSKPEPLTIIDPTTGLPVDLKSVGATEKPPATAAEDLVARMGLEEDLVNWDPTAQADGDKGSL
uniref:Uncharacterized protein n=1 Tax=Eutreptiella gymnastica TaxID=73025 RepID=A0A7S1IN27_9EUGL|mmetsp:Transcript_29045/g.52171  ORF Transcript_29045/g.52171 Transcript_29045/m.52171 type:complete len:430 (+) Transcript_29045:32-1321(+)